MRADGFHHPNRCKDLLSHVRNGGLSPGGSQCHIYSILIQSSSQDASLQWTLVKLHHSLSQCSKVLRWIWTCLRRGATDGYWSEGESSPVWNAAVLFLAFKFRDFGGRCWNLVRVYRLRTVCCDQRRPFKAPLQTWVHVEQVAYQKRSVLGGISHSGQRCLFLRNRGILGPMDVCKQDSLIWN